MRYILASKMWQFFLAIAFLLMQSATAHIHLASSHDHDGYDHSHSQVIHTHSVASHHVDAFASDQDNNASQVIELSQEWRVKYVKWLSDLEPQAVLVFYFTYCEQSVVGSNYFDNPVSYSRFHFRSSVRARAPPRLFPSHV